MTKSRPPTELLYDHKESELPTVCADSRRKINDYTHFISWPHFASHVDILWRKKMGEKALE